MLDYKITPKAEKYIKNIKEKPLKQKFKKAIEEIRRNPHIGTNKKENLSGVLGYDFYYNKTNYEIAYSIVEADGKLLIIILAGTRENFYKELERYINKYRNIRNGTQKEQQKGD